MAARRRMPLRRLRPEVAKLMALSSDWMGSDELLSGPALKHLFHSHVLHVSTLCCVSVFIHSSCTHLLRSSICTFASWLGLVVYGCRQLGTPLYFGLGCDELLKCIHAHLTKRLCSALPDCRVYQLRDNSRTLLSIDLCCASMAAASMLQQPLHVHGVVSATG